MEQSLLKVAGVAFVGLLGALPMVALNLILDVFHPKLIWNSEQEAMKQNMNGFFGMLLSMLIMLVFGLTTFILMILKLPMWFVFFALGVLALLLGVVAVFVLFSVAEKKYFEHEV